MSKFLLFVFLNSFIYANQNMMAFFESIKKQERNLILENFKQEKALRFKLKSKPYFRKSSQKIQGNYQNKIRESKKQKGKCR